jgi:hypothetical protein
MSSTRKSGTENSISLTSTTKIATRILLVSTLAVIGFCLLATPVQPVHASGSLSLGTITVNPNVQNCNPASGWYYYRSGQTDYYAHCQAATVTCSNVANLTLTFGYLNPVGIILPAGSQPNGVIVLHGGDGGIMPESFALTDAYFKAGYEVVQQKWTDDWESIADPMTAPGNIQNAACRPATFFNYVYQTFYAPLAQSTTYHGGMCALGDSAGAAAIAYSLAYYGAGDYLDNVELLSGPVLSDIKQGCELPQPSQVTVCDPNSQNQGYGCQLGGGSTWTLSPTFVAGAQMGVQNWTNEQSTCAVTNPSDPTSNSDWLKESIVDQFSVTGKGAAPTFSYTKTAMSGWLCRSVVNDTPQYDCVANHNSNSNYCPNNSSPQGQIFYQNIPSGTANFSVYAVDNCVNAEGVGAGNVPGYDPSVFNGTVSGFTAISDDMIGNAALNISAQCTRRHFPQ